MFLFFHWLLRIALPPPCLLFLTTRIIEEAEGFSEMPCPRMLLLISQWSLLRSSVKCLHRLGCGNVWVSRFGRL